MQEEIFDPVLTILTYDEFDEIFDIMSGRQKPPDLYIFSEDAEHIRAAAERLRFGCGCINDVIIHLATSGMGAYHGKTGFDAFSHHKSIVDKKTNIDLPIMHRPYKKESYKKLLKKFMK